MPDLGSRLPYKAEECCLYRGTITHRHTLQIKATVFLQKKKVQNDEHRQLLFDKIC